MRGRCGVPRGYSNARRHENGKSQSLGGKTRITVLLLTLVCAVTWAASGAAFALRTVKSVAPAVVGTDAITIPQMLSYQGKLTDTMGIPVNDTTYQVAFRLYTVPSGGSSFWNETQPVTTKSGLFSVLFGSVTPIGAIPDGGALYLGMAVAGGSEMTPRLRIVSAAYAYKADTANYALASAGGGDNAWVRGTPDSVLCTVHLLGLARGGASNMLYGASRQSHVNFGVTCTTGVSGLDYANIVISGGSANRALADHATIGGGRNNTAESSFSTVSGGRNRT